jgi:RNA polymerase sigma-70 factor (ECF subfamily)
MGDEELHQLIRGCIKQDRGCQKMLYKAFYSFSMGICLRYANNLEEAVEVMNQAFFRVFIKIEPFDMERPFKAWLRKIMMNGCLDYYRANLKAAYNEDPGKPENISDSILIDKDLNCNELLAIVQQLPHAYRTVFNLYVLEDYSHEEIGNILNINPRTSMANLHKARQKLKQLILNWEPSVNGTKNNKDGMITAKSI